MTAGVGGSICALACHVSAPPLRQARCRRPVPDAPRPAREVVLSGPPSARGEPRAGRGAGEYSLRGNRMARAATPDGGTCHADGRAARALLLRAGVVKGAGRTRAGAGEWCRPRPSPSEAAPGTRWPGLVRPRSWCASGRGRCCAWSRSSILMTTPRSTRVSRRRTIQASYYPTRRTPCPRRRLSLVRAIRTIPTESPSPLSVARFLLRPSHQCRAREAGQKDPSERHARVPPQCGKVGRVSATRRGAGGVAPEVVPRAEEALMPGEWRLWTVGPDDGHELELADHRVEGDAFDLLPRCAQRADLRESHGGPRRRRRVRWCRGPGR